MAYCPDGEYLIGGAGQTYADDDNNLGLVGLITTCTKN